MFRLVVALFVMLTFSVTVGVQWAAASAGPSEFATEHQGCLGPLRSAIAQGDFVGVGPFGEHFTGAVNPGSHTGTFGEERFLQEVLGISDVAAFCAQFETRPAP